MRRALAILALSLGFAVPALTTPLAPLFARPALRLIPAVSGLPLKEGVDFERLSPDETRQRLQAQIEDSFQRDDIVAYSRLLHAFGFFPRPVDLRQAYQGFLEEQAAGFYDHKDRKFYVVEGFDLVHVAAALQEPVTVAHELVHAAQDQAMGLQTLNNHLEFDDDRSRALAFAVEGQATVVGNRVGMPMMPPPYLGPLGVLTADVFTTSMWLPGSRGMNERMASRGRSGDLPLFLRDGFIAHYYDGSRFVWAVERSWGKDAHLYMACHPPMSTEHALHPAKFMTATDPPLNVEVDVIGFAPVRRRTPQGEWGLRWLLRRHWDRVAYRTWTGPTPEQAAEGWGGDTMALLADDTAVWRIVMDAEHEAQELEPAMQRAMEGAQVKSSIVRIGREVQVWVGLEEDEVSRRSVALARAPVDVFPPNPPPPEGSPCWKRPWAPQEQ
ncbi:MAG: hypothetical protein AB2A00_09335 [Myxococcota bacterium]